PVFDERFGDLRTRAVARAEEEQARPTTARLHLASRWPRREPGMEEATGVTEQVPTAGQVRPVIDVSAVGGAAAPGDEAGASELGQVIGDDVLRLCHQLHEFADSAIAVP